MDDDVLSIGPRRRRPWLWRAIALAAVAGVAGGYALTRGSDRPEHRAQPVPSPSVTYNPVTTAPALPPWPQAEGACGSTAFLPIVSAAPLSQHTGLRFVVGDRLHAVDVDARSVQAVRGLPAGSYASAVGTADDGTYALLARCGAQFGAPADVVRLDGTGRARHVARGPYAALLSGGAHIWAVSYPATGDGPVRVDGLDGSRPVVLPSGFQPMGAYGRTIVGATQVTDAVLTVQVLDPATGRLRALARASSMAVGSGLVLWSGTNCGRCPVFVRDLATDLEWQLPGAVPGGSGVWSAVISPDGRYAALVQQADAPARYDMGHPGNPNRLVLLDLRTGVAAAVPRVELWAKSVPGLAFSPDGRWLAVALDEGGGVRMLLWHPGLPQPLESPAYVVGKVAFAPVLVAAP